MLQSVKLGLSAGIIWGISLFVITFISLWTGYAGLFLTIVKSIYPGYTVSYEGSIVGLIYGFIDAFIGFFLLGLIYNWLVERK